VDTDEDPLYSTIHNASVVVKAPRVIVVVPVVIAEIERLREETTIVPFPKDTLRTLAQVNNDVLVSLHLNMR
jgi:hypothetical protein